jgi:hypothetical protein
MADDSALNIEMELYSAHLKRLQSLSDTAQLFRIFAGAILIVSITAGVLIALQTDDTGLGSDHPYIALGVGTAFSGLVFAMSMNLAAIWALAWVAGRSLDTAVRDED